MTNNNRRVRARYRPSARNLMDQIREVVRYNDFGERTERIFVKWILEFIRFNGLRHPSEMGKQEIERFLNHLSVNKKFAMVALEEAKNAILFLYREVMDSPLDDQIRTVKPGQPTHPQNLSGHSNISSLYSRKMPESRMVAV